MGRTMTITMASKITTAAAWAALALGAAACGRSGTAAAPSASATPPPGGGTPAQAAAPATPPRGPDILTTTSDGAAPPLQEVASAHGVFRITPVGGVDTLTLDGKPVSYKLAEGGGVEPVQANDSLTLVGVFELKDESVAYVVIGGGTACPGTHVLVPAGLTQAVQGMDIKGCDDRGTVRKVGDRLVFDAGGTSGTYDHGRVL